MITPPIAIDAFAAASVEQTPAMATGLASVRFGWLAYIIPVLFVFSPTLLLIGEPGEITIAIGTAAAGVWLVSASLAGYFLKKLSNFKRLLFATFGMSAQIPAGIFEAGYITDVVGVLGGLLLVVTELSPDPWRSYATRRIGKSGQSRGTAGHSDSAVQTTPSLD